MRLLPSVRLLAALGAVTLLASCRTETTGPRFDADAHITAQVGSQEFAANYYVQSAIAQLQGDTLLIGGLDLETSFAGREMVVVIPRYTGPGVYTLGARGSTGASGFVVLAPDMRLSPAQRDTMDARYHTAADAGQILIETHDRSIDRITGTFGFVAINEGNAADTLIIGGGQFAGLVTRAR